VRRYILDLRNGKVCNTFFGLVAFRDPSGTHPTFLETKKIAKEQEIEFGD
jgi:hypothetical protein